MRKFWIFLLLFALVGCTRQPTQAEQLAKITTQWADHTVIPATEAVDVSRIGTEMVCTPLYYLDGNGYLHGKDGGYATTWDMERFNVDHGPFVDLWQDTRRNVTVSWDMDDVVCYAQKTDGSWILLPPYHGWMSVFEMPMETIMTNADFYAYEYPLALAPANVYPYTVVWLSDVEISEPMIFDHTVFQTDEPISCINGTVEAIVLNFSYRMPYAVPQPQLAYAQDDFSSCETFDEILEKLLSGAYGTPYRLMGGQGKWRSLVPLQLSEFNANLPSEEDVRETVKRMGGNLLYRDGTLDVAPYFAEAAQWENITDFWATEEYCYGLSSNGTTQLCLSSELSAERAAELSERFLSESFTGKRTDIRAFAVIGEDPMPVYLYHDGTLALGLPSPFTFPDRCLDMDTVFEYSAEFYYGTLYLRTVDGATVTVKPEFRDGELISYERNVLEDFIRPQ